MRISYQTFLEPVYKSEAFEGDTLNFIELEKEITTHNKYKFKIRNHDIYFIQENDKCDVEQAINLQGKGLDSKEYRDLQYKLKKTQVVKPEHHQCITVFEDVNEVFFFTFKNNTFQLSYVDHFKDRSIVKSKEKDLFYLIIKNEFSISPINYLTVSPRKVVKLHTGFYNLKTQRKGVEPLFLGVLDNTVYTPKPTEISSSYLFQVDKRTLYSYKTQEAEYVILEAADDLQAFEKFNKDDLKNNILVLYTYKDTEIKFEKIILDSKLNTFNFTHNSTEDLFKIDNEFKKNYLFTLYRTPVNLDSDTIDLFSQQILQDIEQNKSKYASNVHIVNGI